MPDPEFLEIGNPENPISVTIRRHPRARRITLKVVPRRGAELVLPKRASLRSGAAFAREKVEWIEKQLGRMPILTQIASGQTLSVMGREIEVCHNDNHSCRPHLNDNRLEIGGSAELVHRSVKTWLKRLAEETLTPIAKDYAEQLGVDVASVRVREMHSRWGSCSADKKLSFCWRLILAPEPIIHYLAAHEVAHLRHMNHSPRFWQTVEELYPDYKAARQWLRQNGGSLQLVE